MKSLHLHTNVKHSGQYAKNLASTEHQNHHKKMELHKYKWSEKIFPLTTLSTSTVNFIAVHLCKLMKKRERGPLEKLANQVIIGDLVPKNSVLSCHVCDLFNLRKWIPQLCSSCSLLRIEDNHTLIISSANSFLSSTE